MQDHSAGILYNAAELRKIASLLEQELKRSLEGPWTKAKPPLYYLSYLFRNHKIERLGGRLGALDTAKKRIYNSVYCDLRVGSYHYDNMRGGALKSNKEQEEALAVAKMPLAIAADAFRFELWRLTDSAYREAIDHYYKQKSHELHYAPLYPRLASRSRQGPHKAFSYKNLPPIDRDYWSYLIAKAGKIIKKFHAIKNSYFAFDSCQKQELLSNSEGSHILKQSQLYELHAQLWLLSSKGESFSQEINLLEGKAEDLPSEKDFLAMIKERIQLLFHIAKAPRLNSFSGPALLSPQASGIFFHEVLGHRLEGSRLLSQEEGVTFLDLKEKRIIPEYIDIVDDPRLKYYDKRSMVGHFQYDDEGSPAQRALLVEKGILKNFLSTTAPLPKQKHNNGHARNAYGEKAMSRMGNVFILNHRPVPKKEMRALLLEEIQKQKKDYGIYIKELLGGETGTGAYDFQAFKGEILHVCKVLPNGKEEIIQGVDFIGTPLSALDAIRCLGDQYEMYNSYCGAESGIIPVSTVAPAMLLRNLELQGRDRERFTQHVLDLPYV